MVGLTVSNVSDDIGVCMEGGWLLVDGEWLMGVGGWADGLRRADSISAYSNISTNDVCGNHPLF